MKAKLLFVVTAIFMASCSTPKYSYKFDYHDYNAGRKNKEALKEVASNPGPVEIQPEMLVAEAPAVEPATRQIVTEATSKEKSAPLTLTKAERREMVKDLRKTVKNAFKQNKAVDTIQTDQSAKAMDHDLKMSLIFLVIALAASLLYGVSPPLTAVIWLIAIVISIVFFIKWLARQ